MDKQYTECEFMRLEPGVSSRSESSFDRSNKHLRDVILVGLTSIQAWVEAFIHLRGRRPVVVAYFFLFMLLFLVVRPALMALGFQRPNFSWVYAKSNNLWLIRRPDGLLFYCRPLPAADIIVQSDSYESKLQFAFAQIKSGTFLDVGAHIGKYTVSAARRLNGRGRVLAVEPEDENYQILRRNIAANNLDNVVCFQGACFSSNTCLKLFVNENAARHSLISADTGSFQYVDARTIDWLVEKFKVTDLSVIKIDVEGAESEVLKGANRTLKVQHPQIVFEAPTLIELRKCRRVLSEYGYHVHYLQPSYYHAA